MARSPSRRALGVALGALLGALLPAVYGLQLLLDQTLGTQAWLEGPLRVQIAGQDPLLLALSLAPQPDAAPALEFEGVGPLQQPVYPWESTEFTGRLWLRLEAELLADPLGSRSTGWSATYFVGDPTGESTRPPAPCSGDIVVSDVASRTTESPQPLAGLATMSLKLVLQCRSPGPDGRPATGDDLTWLLDGDLDLRRGRRAGGSTGL